MRVATCTPVDFVANAHFFGRDSGLLCRGFQAAGVSCISIMPGLATPQDAPDLVRCRQHEIVDTEWWRSRGLDLVVLYAWGDPAYRPVADAIRGAGIRLIQSLDTAGLTTPFGDISEWWRCTSGMMSAPLPISIRIRHLAKAVRDFFPGLYEKQRLGMIDQSDRVAAVSPAAALSICRYANALGFTGIAAKTIIIPHPVPPIMRYSGETKENVVLAVGRWETSDAAQKDPQMLLETLRMFLAKHPHWKSIVVGRGGKALGTHCASWSPQMRERMIWEETLEREELATRYSRSKILLCPSRFESFHISSAEAVCSGCSVVVAKHPLLASTEWFTTIGSGTLAKTRTSTALSATLCQEADAWEGGHRDPAKISGAWCDILQAKQVAGRVLKIETTMPDPL